MCTGTYKLKKRDLQAEGFNPSLITDRLLLLDVKARQYVELDAALYSQLVAGKLRL